MGATKYYWHFLRSDRQLRWNSDGKPVKVGGTYSATGRLVMCSNGMHASVRALDALRYAPGPIACRVKLSGDILKSPDKVCARSRKILDMVDATTILHRFACRVATKALALAGVTDDVAWNAIRTKRRWLAGIATNAELAAAWFAARDSAWKATRDAVWTAAMDAGARDAAWEAAREAARATARDAAWDIARGAAYEVSRYAAGYDEQNEILEQMLLKAMKEKN